MIGKVLSWLYGWHAPPAGIAGDIADLNNHPGERLARGPVEIGPARTTPAFAIILLAAVAIVWGAATSRRQPDVEFVAINVFMGVMLLCAAVWLWSIRCSRLILDTDGVVFRTRRSQVFCPWSLFNAAGAPFHLHANARHRIQMPINPAAIPEVTLTTANLSQKTGTDVTTPEFKFGKSDSLKLHLMYAVDPTTIANLLLQVGRRLAANDGAAQAPAARGTQLPGGRAGSRSAAVTWVGGDEAVIVAHNDWITVDAVRVQFPPLCCLCGQATDETFRFAPKVRYLGFFEGPRAQIDIPCCGPCGRTVRRRQWTGRWTILGCCMALGFSALAALLGAKALIDELLRLEGGTVIGWLVVSAVMVRIFWRYADELFSPVHARYHPLAKRFSFWFRQRDYADQVQAFIRRPTGWIEPHARKTQDERGS